MKKPYKILVACIFLSVCALSVLALAANVDRLDMSYTSSEKGDMQEKNKEGRRMKWNILTQEEERVIVHKGTERPYTGKYLSNKESGLYTCRRCNAPLYTSADKFDSQCGWPSFDDAVPGAVLRVPDADGVRVEIVCANCGAHLGHVFEGEGFTEKNVRHCVNSVSMDFVAERAAPAVAFFGGGCFWGVEDGFSKLNGVLDVVSGYMGGTTIFPTYKDVTRGDTNHAEVVKVEFDPSKTDFETLARFFFEIHDPTQVNRQGVDVGTQYRSVIFYTEEAQRLTAAKLIDILEQKGYAVVTELAPAPAFFAAEDYHQDFTQRTGRGACHLPVKRFD